MINRLLKTNSFGGNTYFIDLEKIYKIEIDDDLKGNLIVKNYRRGIFKDKLLYSFTHSDDWTSLIPEMIERLRDYTNSNEKQRLSDNYWMVTMERCSLAIPKK